MSTDNQPKLRRHLSYELIDYEVFWRDHCYWLKDCGYQLRARYQPEWVPSWKGNQQFSLLCEDGIWISHGAVVMDAIRISDGKPVALKRISQSRHPNELSLHRYLTSEPLASDPRNHCVPLLGILRPPDDDDTVIIIMPLLCRYDVPRFDTFGEVIEFIRQAIEGLQFLHENRIAHKDIHHLNIMVDAQPLFPEGFHPLRPYRKPDFSGRSRWYTRTRRPVKYYYIDFGISKQYQVDDFPVVDTIVAGADKSPSEYYRFDFMHDPFATDIYHLGNLIRKEFLEGKPDPYKLLGNGYYGFSFLKPLVDDMVLDIPEQRPNVAEVAERYNEIVAGLSSWKLRSRAVPRLEGTLFTLFRTPVHWIRRIGIVIMRKPSIPRV